MYSVFCFNKHTTSWIDFAYRFSAVVSRPLFYTQPSVTSLDAYLIIFIH